MLICRGMLLHWNCRKLGSFPPSPKVKPSEEKNLVLGLLIESSSRIPAHLRKLKSFVNNNSVNNSSTCTWYGWTPGCFERLSNNKYSDRYITTITARHKHFLTEKVSEIPPLKSISSTHYIFHFCITNMCTHYYAYFVAIILGFLWKSWLEPSAGLLPSRTWNPAAGIPATFLCNSGMERGRANAINVLLGSD